MKVNARYLVKTLKTDLNEKMVFLGGPRQVGKTTVAKDLIAVHFKHKYYNWDKLSERNAALNGEWPVDTELIVLDEFHKYRKWKTWIKGEYDTLKDKYKFLLIGSARLNIYRRGGDSLQGRYHYYRLHPFSYVELHSSIKSLPEPGEELVFFEKTSHTDFDDLFHFGGFPEPLFKQNERFLRRWHNERLERFFKEDIRELTMIQDFGSLSLLADLLPEKTSSILSINSLARDLGINFRTVARWLDTFETFYYCFRVPSFQSKKVASVKKEKKLYLWDWSQIKNRGAKIENMVASHLLKFCNYHYDFNGWKVTLNYLRDSSGRETDFLVCLNDKPWFAVEVKTSEMNISKHLLYFRKKLNITHCYQIVLENNKDYMKNGIRVMPVEKFLTALI